MKTETVFVTVSEKQVVYSDYVDINGKLYEELPNRIVLTKEELKELLEEFKIKMDDRATFDHVTFLNSKLKP